MGFKIPHVASCEYPECEKEFTVNAKDLADAACAISKFGWKVTFREKPTAHVGTHFKDRYYWETLCQLHANRT